jgi:hypothetical protein
MSLFTRVTLVRRLVVVITEHLDYMLYQPFLDLTMPGHRLRDFGLWVLIPIMLAAMANKNTSHIFNCFYQVSSFYNISSSATRSTFGIVPLLNSL